MKAIGGYFELELPIHKEYHAEAIPLNSGRFCLEYLLRCRKYTKVYVPYYTCDTAIEPMQKLGIQCAYYHIDKEMHLTEILQLKENEALLYTNYWGLQNAYCKELASIYGKQLILDYTQAFFSLPIPGIDTFYSCRKFFGVPDGGYLYSDASADFLLEQDESYTRIASLIKRIDLSPEEGYHDFHETSATFHHIPLLQMSKFTKRMMQSIDYNHAVQKRIANYNILRAVLGGKELEENEVPMIFPYMSQQGQALRQKLIANKVFVAKYWPNVTAWSEPDSLEIWLANHILPLPIDQRYDEKDMERIIQLIQM